MRNVLGSRKGIRRTLASLAIGAVSVLGTAGPAAATVPPGTNPISWPINWVQWINAKTGNCLISNVYQGGSYGNLTPGSATNIDTESCVTSSFLGERTKDGSEWIDPALGGNLYYEISSMTWNDATTLAGAASGGAYCLDSNAQYGTSGTVYVIPCNWNNWEMWLELSTATGWALQDYHTGLWLDGGGGGNGHGVYTNQNYGNGDSYQRWH